MNILGFTSELDALRDDMRSFVHDVEERVPDLVTPQRRELIETDLPEALGFIRTSTSKMDRLINAILTLSREGRRTLRPEKVELTALIEAQGETLAQQLASKQAEILIEGKLPELVSDRLAIEQIFGNLIENAVKYLTADRAGRIVVRGRTEGAMNRYQIADNGRGIAAKDLERIFELFRRSGEQNTKGEGIGLAYVRNLTRRLGGGVAVESELGVGVHIYGDPARRVHGAGDNRLLSLRARLRSAALPERSNLDQLLDARGQRFHREGLGHDVHAGVQMAVAQDGVLGVACNKQHLQVRPHHAGGVGDLRCDPDADRRPNSAPIHTSVRNRARRGSDLD